MTTVRIAFHRTHDPHALFDASKAQLLNAVITFYHVLPTVTCAWHFVTCPGGRTRPKKAQIKVMGLIFGT